MAVFTQYLYPKNNVMLIIICKLFYFDLQYCSNQFICLLQVPKCFMLVEIFWLGPKIELYLVSFQKNCTSTKTELDEWKSIFGLAQKIWKSPKYFGEMRHSPIKLHPIFFYHFFLNRCICLPRKASNLNFSGWRPDKNWVSQG